MAKEYIEREYLVKEAEAVLDFRKKYYTDKDRIADAASTVEWLKYYAPAADVVEVVRCRDCKHRVDWHEEGYADDTGMCIAAIQHIVAPNHFCSYGERRDNNAAD